MRNFVPLIMYVAVLFFGFPCLHFPSRKTTCQGFIPETLIRIRSYFPVGAMPGQCNLITSAAGCGRRVWVEGERKKSIERLRRDCSSVNSFCLFSSPPAAEAGHTLVATVELIFRRLPGRFLAVIENHPRPNGVLRREIVTKIVHLHRPCRPFRRL